MTEARERPVLVDSHVHCHPSFDLEQFLDHAHCNFSRAAAQQATSGDPVGLLALTEGRGERSFERLGGCLGRPLSGGWQIDRTNEPGSLVARRAGGLELAIVAGRQIRLQGGLEVLAIGGNPALEDGGSLETTAAAIRRAGALPVLPWGFGKWWLRRGRLVERILERTPPADLLLADSGTRAALAPYPRLLARAERQGFRIVAGSDPLPLAGEVARPGSYGCLLRGPFSIEAPAAGLRRMLATGQPRPRLYGRGRPLPGFLRDQLAMQLRRRRS